jgi:hypothetical protein
LFVLTLGLSASPRMDFTFPPIVSGLSMCQYRFQMVAFDDQDGNGIRDPNDPGLPQVNLMVSYPDPTPERSSTVNISRSVASNENGLAVVGVIYNACPSTGTQYGSMMMTVQTPPGYKATTETTFGPFSIKWTGPASNGVRTVYAGFTKQPNP